MSWVALETSRHGRLEGAAMTLMLVWRRQYLELADKLERQWDYAVIKQQLVYVLKENEALRQQLQEKRQERQKKWPPCNNCIDEAGCDPSACELRAIINGRAVCRT